MDTVGGQRYQIIDGEYELIVQDIWAQDIIRIPYSAIPFLLIELEKRNPEAGSEN